jgi:hypothetical protein
VKPIIVEEDLLHDEGGNRAGELLPLLHDAQAERYDLGLHQEVDGVGVVALHERTNDAEAGDA